MTTLLFITSDWHESQDLNSLQPFAQCALEKGSSRPVTPLGIRFHRCWQEMLVFGAITAPKSKTNFSYSHTNENGSVGRQMREGEPYTVHREDCAWWSNRIKRDVWINGRKPSSRKRKKKRKIFKVSFFLSQTTPGDQISYYPKT